MALTSDDYPLIMLPIVNKPLICYQIEYLQKYGIRDIMITVIKSHASKVEKYIKNYFKNCEPKTNIDLIVFPEDKFHFEVLQSI
jgi:NDP-sugar pyrophosphorylase family protein